MSLDKRGSYASMRWSAWAIWAGVLLAWWKSMRTPLVGGMVIGPGQFAVVLRVPAKAE